MHAVLKEIEKIGIVPVIKIDDAKNWCNAKTTSGIISCCTGKYKTSGKHPTTNDSLKWMYYKDYIKEFDESTLLSFDRLSA